MDLIFVYCRLIADTATATAAVGNTQNNKGGLSDLQRIWGEMSTLDTIFFDQTSPGGPYDYAPNLAERVIAYGTESCLKAGSMLNETEDTFPLEAFLETIRMFAPKNCILERCSEGAFEEMQQTRPENNNIKQSIFGKQIEKWYGVEYYLTPIDHSVTRAWEGSREEGLGKIIDPCALHLPRPNRYIPRTLELCSDLPGEAKKGPRIEKAIDPPKLLLNDANGRLFHRLDDRYALPQSSISFMIRNAAVHHTKKNGIWVYDAKSGLLSSLISGAFNEAMAQETYDAELAGLYWSVWLGSSGIKLSCFGFSDRLPELALKVLGKSYGPSCAWSVLDFLNPLLDR